MTLRTGAPLKPAFRELVRFWWKLGWISFGGTAAHLAIMHGELVERKKWISNRHFLHALSHCMILPGPEASQLAIYIGWKLHGKKGGLAAGSLFVLPSTFVLLVFSILYVRFGNLPWINAMFGGLKPAVIALIILALFRIASRALRQRAHWVTATLAFTALFLFDASLPLVMLAAVSAGLIFGALWPSLIHSGTHADPLEREEVALATEDSVRAGSTPLWRSLINLAAATLLVWLTPLLLLALFAPDFQFWKTLSLFFTKAAFVTIGGSYTVIPYVAQVTVTQLHWLSKLQMMDGFALAETTPGPLIIVVSFVGFMAAFNHFHGSYAMGTLALLLTTFYTFLPCFLFVFAGAPLVERTHGKPAIEGVLGLITSVVVAGILNLTLFLGKAVIFPAGVVTIRAIDVVSVLWTLVSLALLKRWSLNVVYLVLLSLAFGALRYYFALHPS